jgi:hypothetical protein
VSSFWQVIKSAFTPWKLLERGADDAGGGMGSIEFGQTMIDGMAGDGITNVAAAADHEAPARARPEPAEPKVERRPE